MVPIESTAFGLLAFCVILLAARDVSSVVNGQLGLLWMSPYESPG
jgi:hypothetical protein